MLLPEGQVALRKLTAATGAVGVWGRAGRDPDCLASLQALVAAGVSFVNSDLPRSFLERPD